MKNKVLSEFEFENYLLNWEFINKSTRIL
jgi:hypothetical protein